MPWPKGIKRVHGRRTRANGTRITSRPEPKTPKTPAKPTMATKSQPQPRPCPSPSKRGSKLELLERNATNQTAAASVVDLNQDHTYSSGDDTEDVWSSDEEGLLHSSPERTSKRLPQQLSGRTATPRHQRALRRHQLKSSVLLGIPDVDGQDPAGIMSSQQGKWREEQVLIICPGSQTTMAQLGCAELTPPAHRIPTRMFKDEETGEYLPYYTFKRSRTSAGNGDEHAKLDEDDYEYVEDRDSVEGAVYPIIGGRIANMEAFLAFLDHVHSLLTTTYHNTPIVLMASPQWTRPDHETIARYVFEKTKTPALCLLHSAVAAQYGIKWPTMTVVDIGFEKVDVTCLYDNIVVSNKTLGFPNPDREISGGEVFTQKLLSLLKDKSLTRDMVEQLKRSSLCEVLPYDGELDELMELPTETGAPSQPLVAEALKPTETPKPAPQIGAEDDNGIVEEKTADDEGVLDVANIVTSGNAREFIAKKEKEKAARGKKSKGQEPEPAKAVRLPNSKRRFATFHYEELVHEDVTVPVSDGAPQPASENPTNGEAAPVSTEAAPASSEDATAPAVGETVTELPFAAEAATPSVTERRTKRVRKDFDIGLERFLFADRGEIDRITETIYRTIQSIDDIYKRSGCWDNIVFVGNGSRLRGLKENVMQTLHARHLISPSSATIFTSELPSNMATPTGTGSQTPTGSFNGQLPLPTSSSVNPLLQAATTASMGIPGSVQAPGSTAGEVGPSHHSHAQTPTSIKMATLPTYLAEWTKNGFEEAMFLGSLITARLAYCIHNLGDAQTLEAQRGMSLNRVDYNELGPKAVNTHSMLG
ncbi:hypothetical protein TruAng_002737 [Truncatella angustata]|nr:hypothetical protein TruAng_002737 [Truncatella angustata]